MKGVHDFFFQLMKVHTSPQRFPGPLLRSSIPPLRRGPSQPLLVSRPFAGAVCSRYPHISQDHFKKNKFIYARRAIRDLQKNSILAVKIAFRDGFLRAVASEGDLMVWWSYLTLEASSRAPQTNFPCSSPTQASTSFTVQPKHNEHKVPSLSHLKGCQLSL